MIWAPPAPCCPSTHTQTHFGYTAVCSEASLQFFPVQICFLVPSRPVHQTRIFLVAIICTIPMVWNPADSLLEKVQEHPTWALLEHDACKMFDWWSLLTEYYILWYLIIWCLMQLTRPRLALVGVLHSGVFYYEFFLFLMPTMHLVWGWGLSWITGLQFQIYFREHTWGLV